MRRLAIALLAISMVGVGASSVVAAEPSPSAEATGHQVEVPGSAREDPGVEPTIEAGRVESPVEGFTVTFPAIWEVRVFGDAMHERVKSELGTEVVPRPVAGGLGVDGEGCLLSDATLLVQEVSGWESVEEAAAGTADNATGVGWSEVSSSIVDLPAGRAARVELVKSDGTHQDHYVYTDGQQWFELLCSAKTRPLDDRWLSIAETFEFLPAEE